MNRPEYASMFELEDTHWWFVGRRRLAFALIEKFVTFQPESRILDVGCGTGGNLQAMKKYGQVNGLDINAIALEFARKRSLPHLTQASGLALPHPDNTFDLVTIFDVLYHRWIIDDAHAIQELYRVLHPGGWLVLTDSALPSLWSSHDEVYHARQRYTLQVMNHKLTQAGFEQRVSSYANMLLLPIFLLVRLTMDWLPVHGNIDRRGTFPNWLNWLLTQIRGFEAAWLRRGWQLPVGSSLICVCHKPDTMSNEQ